MDKKFPLALIGFFAVMTAGIIFGAYINFSHFREYHLKEVEEQLFAVSGLKIAELSRWRDERIGDGNLFFNNRTFNYLVSRLNSNPGDVSARSQILSWFEKFRTSYSYKEIILCDHDGNVKVSSPENSRFFRKHLTAQTAELFN